LGFTIVQKDSFANSKIISEKAKKRSIGRRELKRLKLGKQVIVARNVQ
jgi:C4-type Zn-finger protein